MSIMVHAGLRCASVVANSNVHKPDTSGKLSFSQILDASTDVDAECLLSENADEKMMIEPATVGLLQSTDTSVPSLPVDKELAVDSPLDCELVDDVVEPEWISDAAIDIADNDATVGKDLPVRLTALEKDAISFSEDQLLASQDQSVLGRLSLDVTQAALLPAVAGGVDIQIDEIGKTPLESQIDTVANNEDSQLVAASLSSAVVIPDTPEQSATSSSTPSPEIATAKAVYEATTQSFTRNQQNLLNHYQLVMPTAQKETSITPTAVIPFDQVVEEELPVPQSQLNNVTAVPIDNSVATTFRLTMPMQNPQWTQQFSQQLFWSTQNNISRAEIHLNPAELGPLSARIRIEDDKASLLFMSHHLQVREAVEAAMPRLKHMFEGSDVELGEVVVTDYHSQLAQEQQQKWLFAQDERARADDPLDDGMHPNAAVRVADVNVNNHRSLVDFYA